MSEPVVKHRQMANMGKLLLVRVDPGEKIFDVKADLKGNLLGEPVLLGVVMNRFPIINGLTVYLSNDDYDAAKSAMAAQGLVRKNTRH